MKRIGSLMLVVPLVLTTVVAGCSSNSKEAAQTAAPGVSASPAATGAVAAKRDVGGLKLPIVDKKLDLSVWYPKSGQFKGQDYNELPSFQTMEKNTGVHLNFQNASGADTTEQFNLLMASGKLPDLIYNSTWDKDVAKYGPKGALLPLEKLIDEHAPNFKKLLADHPDVRGQITSPDGHIYFMPNVVLDAPGLVQMFPQMREDWLKKLNLQSPKTTDDWYNVLKAFREKDPNGNGQKDEIPFTSVNLESIMYLFAPAFGVEYGFYVDNGKVKYGPYDDKFQELLAYLNKLYSEQLIDPNYLVDKDFKLLTQKVTTEKAGAWFGWAGSYMGNFTSLMKDKDPAFKIAPVLPPVGPHGDQRQVSNRWPASGIGLAVSAQTKNPVEVIEWLDYQYSAEGALLDNFGVEGTSYDMVNGNPAYKDSIMHPKAGSSFVEQLLSNTIGGGSWATISDQRYLDQANIAGGVDTSIGQAFGKYIDFNKKIPPLQFLPEESSTIVPIMADADTYVKETINQFVMGKKPVSEFKDFQATLKKMNFDKVLEVYQKAYDRFKGK